MKSLISIPCIFVLILLGSNSMAQDYKLSAGARIGTYFAGTVKSYVSEKGAVEGVVGISRIGGQSLLSLGGYYQIHNKLTANTPTLNWYVGGGAFGTLGNDDLKSNIALSGVIGIEYTFENTPINIFIDALPYYNFIGDTKFDTEASLGVRFVIK